MTTQRASLHVRMPNDLIEAVREKADEQGASLNSYVITLLAGAVEWKPNKKRPRAGGNRPGP